MHAVVQISSACMHCDLTARASCVHAHAHENWSQMNVVVKTGASGSVPTAGMHAVTALIPRVWVPTEALAGAAPLEVKIA